MGPGFGSAAACKTTGNVAVLGGGNPKVTSIGENNVRAVDVGLAKKARLDGCALFAKHGGGEGDNGN